MHVKKKSNYLSIYGKIKHSKLHKVEANKKKQNLKKMHTWKINN